MSREPVDPHALPDDLPAPEDDGAAGDVIAWLRGEDAAGKEDGR